MTPTERGLLAAVSARPDDALGRLVYADWLEAEAGGDGPQRGAYLRAWCELLTIRVRDLDAYAMAAERLEALGAGLDADWLAAVGATRFHLTDPIEVAGRAEAFFLRYGGSEGLLDARVAAVMSTGGDWEVRYTTVADNRALWPPGDAGRVLERLSVDRATGRVHMMDARGRRARTHHPDSCAPSETDGRNP